MNKINEKKGRGGLPYLELCHRESFAHVYLHGGHVLHYQPAGQKPVLWHSRRSAFEDGKPIRGGIPLCWPWFCAHPSDKSQPFHGPVRLSEWTLKDSSVTEESVWVTLKSPAAETGLCAELTVELGSALTLTLAARNISDAPQPLTEALHTYFAVGDIAKVSIAGLDGVRYIDKTADEAVVEQQGGISFAAETNRIYFDTTGESIIHDHEWNRRIRVAKAGSRSTVVWNPWSTQAATIPDMNNDEYPEFVCVETANCGPNALELAPGEEHTLQVQIEVIA